MQSIGVECTFNEDGTVKVKKILLNGRWQPVGQGRQWVDGNGRHVLIMLPSDEVQELILQPSTLRWALVQVGGGKRTAV